MAAGLRLEVSVRLCESQSSERAAFASATGGRDHGRSSDGELGIEELGLEDALYTSAIYWAVTWAACCVNLCGAG